MKEKIFNEIRTWKYSQLTFLFISISLFFLVIYLAFNVNYQLFGLQLKVTDYSIYSIISTTSTILKDPVLSQILIFITLFITTLNLYYKTDKKENSRYKSYEDLKIKYKSENDWLFLINNKSIEIYSCSIDYTKVIKELNINKGISLNDIDFLIANHEYRLPELISSKMYEILQDRFHTQSKEDYNGLTLSLKKITFDVKENKLVFNFYKSSYFKYLVTNVSPNYKILGNVTIEDYLEPGTNKKLSRLEDSLAENHLGISCLVILNDKEKKIKKIIVPKRGNRTTVFKEQLSPSISGALNIHSCLDKDMIPNIKTFFDTEFDEEISRLFKSNKDEDIGIKDNIINNLRLVGISRELLRIGKPEIFFVSEIAYKFDNDEIEKKILTNDSKTDVDLDENKFVYCIEESKIFDLIKEEKSCGMFSSKKDRKIYMNIENKSKISNVISNKGSEEKYLLSESLFVNLIFYYNSDYYDLKNKKF